MNKVERVSIGGFAFSVETDAYGLIDGYLEELEAHYGTHDEGKEIIEGIEERMAELLLERCGTNRVVRKSDVEDITGILGHPEEIDDDNSVPDGKGGTSETTRQKKKLYRDTSESKLGGVCRGLAIYLGIDPIIVRLVFVISSVVLLFLDNDVGLNCGLTPFVIYLILWICIPEAKTVRQRCEMLGEEGKLEDIRRNVENSIRVQQADGGLHSAGGILVNAICLFAGLILLVIGVSGTVGCVALAFCNNVLNIDITQYMTSPWPVADTMLSYGWFRILILAACLIPFVGCIYGGLRMLFGFRAPAWRPGLWLFLLWIAAVTALAIFTVISLSGNGVLAGFPA